MSKADLRLHTFYSSNYGTIGSVESKRLRCIGTYNKYEEEEDDIISVGPLFPKLKQVLVERCDHLGCLIPASFAGGLLQLETLEIKDASGLEYVFGKYNHGEDQNLNQSIDLPVLKVLKLTNLPKNFRIALQNYHVTWPPFDGQHISGCPDLSGMPSFDLEVREQGDNEATKKELELPAQLSSQMIEQTVKDSHVEECKMKGFSQTLKHAINMESDSEPQEDEEGVISAAEREHYLDGDAEDKDEREAEQQHKEEKYAILKNNNSVIKQSAASCVESRELDEEVIEKQPKVELELPLVVENPPPALEEYKEELVGNPSVDLLVQVATEVHHQSKKIDVIDDTQEGIQEQNFHTAGSVNLRERNTEIEELSLHKNPAPEESMVGTSSQVLIDKQPQTVTDPQQDIQDYRAYFPLHVQSSMLSPSTSIFTTSTSEALLISSSMKQHHVTEQLVDFHDLSKPAHFPDKAFVRSAGSHFQSMKQDDTFAPPQEMLTRDSHNEVHGASDFQLHSQKFDAIVDTQKCLQEQYLYPVGSTKSRENNTEIVEGSLHKDPVSEELTVGTSPQELIEKQLQVKLQPPEFVEDTQQALEDYKVSHPLPLDPTVLSPSTGITTTPLTAEILTSSSTNQQPPAEESVDFHGLFKIKARCACLLEEAFVKYRHLRDWDLAQRTHRIRKVGYKSLADMLAFLKLETPKTMDDSKKKAFEDLYYELEFFGFDKKWLASIWKRVMDMQADHNNKLKQLDQLESQVRTFKRTT
ncbi:uncharacterized protein LOC129318270 isoform X3 [Prosopis cineraria]|uniref:uncharacterized protein LOC129318270 isoform X3 n=1 Tax=Prosopis cineraria TaxID=364024 RepID=UPI00240ED8D6|nr:uncharacterized protein LOC129318270 isoform X3 [Prosopis cineraria]